MQQSCLAGVIEPEKQDLGILINEALNMYQYLYSYRDKDKHLPSEDKTSQNQLKTNISCCNIDTQSENGGLDYWP